MEKILWEGPTEVFRTSQSQKYWVSVRGKASDRIQGTGGR